MTEAVGRNVSWDAEQAQPDVNDDNDVFIKSIKKLWNILEVKFPKKETNKLYDPFRSVNRMLSFF